MCKQCRECGKGFTSARRDALFCSSTCRKAFNNRRMIRGAELYDLWMANSYERDLRPLGLFAIMSNLARAYRDSDKQLRNGRPSWNVKETLARLPVAFGSEGDKR